jgi:hypothetical protein
MALNEVRFPNSSSLITEMEEPRTIQEEIIEKRAKDRAWNQIFEYYNLQECDFDIAPFSITAAQIKEATKSFLTTGEREVRILCKQDTRESRPKSFKKRAFHFTYAQWHLFNH